MSSWKCDICGKEFENFHAQGFDNKVYCPLCFFKEENRRLKGENKQLKQWDCNKDSRNSRQKVANKKLQQENKQLKDIRETAINYIDQVVMYKPCAREISEELNTLIGILRGGNNE